MRVVIKNIILLCLPVFGFAQSKLPVLTLDTILSRIERNTPLLESYALQAESYKYSADAATAWMPPMVGMGTFMTPYRTEKAMSPAEKGNIMFQIEQDIPNPAKLNSRKQYIKSKGDVVNAGRDIKLNELRTQAKRLYYSWLIAKNRVVVLSENDRLMNMMKRIEEVRYPYNKSTLSGIYLVDAKLQQNLNMIVMQEGLINKSRMWLMALMHIPPTDSFEIDSVAEPHFVPEYVYDSAAVASARKDIYQMDQNIRSMQLNIASMKFERKPDFKIRFDHMNPVASVMPKAYSVMGMVSIPIAPWSSKMYKSEIKAMEFNIGAMKKEREGMLLETTGMLMGMQAEIRSMHDRVIGLEEKVIPALKKALDANFLLYQENKLELTKVIESWEAFNMMQLQLLDEKLKHYEMIVDYEKELFQ